MIGDPKPTQERPLVSREEIERNVAGIAPQLAKFLDFNAPTNAARVVNNADWLASFDLLGFLRETGKHFTVNYLLQKEAVKRRLEGEGISFTEFSYPLLQARDYLELFDRYHCTLQMGGSDQWGNITAGIDLVRKVRGRKVHGIVMPLITTASGVKFGKTEAGAVWLDPNLTSPFRFYQFWLNVDDRDVITYLKFFTFQTRDEIGELERAAAEQPERREAQRSLARTVTAMVHGEEQVARAERAAALLFGEDLASAPLEDVLMVFDDAPSSDVVMPPDGLTVVDLLTATKLAASRSEAERHLREQRPLERRARAPDRGSGDRRTGVRPAKRQERSACRPDYPLKGRRRDSDPHVNRHLKRV